MKNDVDCRQQYVVNHPRHTYLSRAPIKCLAGTTTDYVNKKQCFVVALYIYTENNEIKNCLGKE